ncbi:unnamed protein product, partial [Polarella glacialis]
VVRGRCVCELGAGLGLCSLLAARLGARSVLCSDGSEEAVKNCKENILRNASVGGVTDVVTTAVVRWEEPPPARQGDEDSDARVGELLWDAEVLLAADVVYDAAAAEALVALTAKLLRKGRAKALYMSLEKRIYFSAATLQAEVAAYPQFLEDCAALGLRVEPVDLSTVPVHFSYVRSRFYDMVVVTAMDVEPAKAREGNQPQGDLGAEGVELKRRKLESDPARDT